MRIDFKQQPSAIAKLSLVCTFFSLFAVICVGSFSILWMHQRIAQVAKDTVALERKHEELLRKLDFLDERITEIHQPVKMQSKVSNRLFPLKDTQVVWVEDKQVLEVNSYAEANNRYQSLIENNL